MMVNTELIGKMLWIGRGGFLLYNDMREEKNFDLMISCCDGYTDAFSFRAYVDVASRMAGIFSTILIICEAVSESFLFLASRCFGNMIKKNFGKWLVMFLSSHECDKRDYFFRFRLQIHCVEQGYSLSLKIINMVLKFPVLLFFCLLA